MVLPNIWGQGQIFAFSALDGASYSVDDFVGTLSGDRLGVCFHTKTRRELAITGNLGKEPVFEMVSGDCICIRVRSAERMKLIYARRHLIIGNVVDGCDAVVHVDGLCERRNEGKTEIHISGDGEFSAIGRKAGRFAFAFGKSEDAVVELVRNGLEMDPDEEMKKKVEFFHRYTLSEKQPHAALYAKCLSVLKTQLYSPEGSFGGIWSTPDRLPHRHLWLWDSVFHAVGHRNLHPDLAEELILAVLDVQQEDGFIPHMARIDGISAITQPPIIAWGALKVYEKSKNAGFLKRVYEANCRFLNWCRDNRRDNEEELYTWLTQKEKMCRCDESGMDNSPRFDAETRLQAIDFTCYMANDIRCMKEIALILGDDCGSVFFDQWYEKIREAAEQKLWSEEDRFYFDYDLPAGRLRRIWSVASFLPLFAGICDEERAECLVQHLVNPDSFGTVLPIPSISRKDPTYGTDMWHGPVWLNFNYMIAEGLGRYGYGDRQQPHGRHDCCGCCRSRGSLQVSNSAC